MKSRTMQNSPLRSSAPRHNRSSPTVKIRHAEFLEHSRSSRRCFTQINSCITPTLRHITEICEACNQTRDCATPTSSSTTLPMYNLTLNLSLRSTRAFLKPTRQPVGLRGWLVGVKLSLRHGRAGGMNFYYVHLNRLSGKVCHETRFIHPMNPIGLHGWRLISILCQDCMSSVRLSATLLSNSQTPVKKYTKSKFGKSASTLSKRDLLRVASTLFAQQGELVPTHALTHREVHSSVLHESRASFALLPCVQGGWCESKWFSKGCQDSQNASRRLTHEIIVLRVHSRLRLAEVRRAGLGDLRCQPCSAWSTLAC